MSRFVRHKLPCIWIHRECIWIHTAWTFPLISLRSDAVMSHDSINLESDAVMYHDSIMLKRADLLHFWIITVLNCSALHHLIHQMHQMIPHFLKNGRFTTQKLLSCIFWIIAVLIAVLIVELHLLNHHRVNCRVYLRDASIQDHSWLFFTARHD